MHHACVCFCHPGDCSSREVHVPRKSILNARRVTRIITCGDIDVTSRLRPTESMRGLAWESIPGE